MVSFTGTSRRCFVSDIFRGIALFFTDTDTDDPTPAPKKKATKSSNVPRILGSLPVPPSPGLLAF